MKKIRLFALITVLCAPLIINAQVTECSWYAPEYTGLSSDAVLSVLPDEDHGLLVASFSYAFYFDDDIWIPVPPVFAIWVTQFKNKKPYSQALQW